MEGTGLARFFVISLTVIPLQSAHALIALSPPRSTYPLDHNIKKAPSFLEQCAPLPSPSLLYSGECGDLQIIDVDDLEDK